MIAAIVLTVYILTVIVASLVGRYLKQCDEDIQKMLNKHYNPRQSFNNALRGNLP